MKKIIVVILMTFLLVGCGEKMGNTPTKKVEDFINNYQTLDQSVLEDIDGILDSEEYTAEQKSTYRDIVKKNYQKMTYKVKDEVVDGDNSVVTVEVTVIDYSKANNEADLYLLNNPDEFNNEQGEYDVSKFIDYRLNKLKEVDDTVTYTLELELHKNGDEWELNDLDDVELSKINGTYNY